VLSFDGTSDRTDGSSSKLPVFAPCPGGIRISAIVAHRLLSSLRDMAEHGRQPFQGVVGFLLLPVLRAVGDLGLISSVFHTLLREGWPNQIGGQILQGFLLPRLDALAGKDAKAGVPPAVEHVDELAGDLSLPQEHGKHLDAEELLQVLGLEFRGDPEQAFSPPHRPHQPSRGDSFAR